MQQLLAGAADRRQRILAKIQKDATRNKPELLEAVYNKTMKEVDDHVMGPPLSLPEVRERYGDFFNIVQRYGTEQGVDDKGQIKYRCIDNHLDNANNEAAERRQVVPMASVSHILLMTRAMHAALGPMQEDPEWELRGATEDLKAAYRQCPLLSSQVAVAITAVWCPHGGPYCRGTVQFHEMYGQPFGAGHAVPNSCRLAEWASRVTRRLLLLVLDHFFDDYFLVEPKCS